MLATNFARSARHLPTPAPIPVRPPKRNVTMADIGYHERPTTVTRENLEEVTHLSLEHHRPFMVAGVVTWRIVCCAGAPGQITVLPDGTAHVSHGFGKPLSGRWMPGRGEIVAKGVTLDADGAVV